MLGYAGIGAERKGLRRIVVDKPVQDQWQIQAVNLRRVASRVTELNVEVQVAGAAEGRDFTRRQDRCRFDGDRTKNVIRF